MTNDVSREMCGSTRKMSKRGKSKKEIKEDVENRGGVMETWVNVGVFCEKGGRLNDGDLGQSKEKERKKVGKSMETKKERRLGRIEAFG